MKTSPAHLLGLAVFTATLFSLNEAVAQFSERVLHAFSGAADGQQPYAGLVQGTDGALYGTTYLGGRSNAGVIFKVNADGSGNVPIYNFVSNNADPFGLAYPSGLIQGLDGALYGTTGFGGTAGHGSVFRINPDGSGYSILHSFNQVAGYEPAAALVQGNDGTLFGTTQAGALGGAGTVFRLNSDGTGFAELYTFGLLMEDPRSPQAPLIQGADGALYGTTTAGGASGYGTVFKINSDGTGLTVLHSFVPVGGDGQRPYGGLVVGHGGGALYGTTQQGGNFADGGNTGFGTVFKLNPDGTGYTNLHSFNPASGDGKLPNSALVVGNDGALYGTTEFGGSNNFGAIFRISRDGSDYSLLYSFGSTPLDGSYPKAPLVRASDGGLFGTTQFGGNQNFGSVFRLAPSRTIISSVTVLPSKAIRLSINGTPNFEYRIEASSDQVHWTTLTNLYTTNTVMEFTDFEASKFPQRFYRGAWIP
jgi:uncharacterized repeat protein (TIGR03803 family)